ncbi:hypothetical protein LIER_42099 [Lithospermum erythrorhizon]|uniref:Uncharacterized protein n=1 Tax=Lithospermum erythrorhizon TaxID=34254 RepID=A0AAV3RJK8_LITER
MASTKRTIRRISHPRKRAESAGGVKLTSPYSSPPPSPSRPIVGLLSPRLTPDKTTYDALAPLLDQGIMQRMANPGFGPKAPHEASRLWLQAASTSQTGRSAHHPVPANHRFERGAGSEAPQGRSAGGGVVGPSPPSQQLPLGYGPAGPIPEAVPGREGCRRPSLLLLVGRGTFRKEVHCT